MPPLDEQSPIPFWPHLLFDYLFALMALLGLALIPAVHQRLQASSPLLTWSAGVAQVGFALTAIVSLWQADYETSLWREAASEASGSLGLLQGGWSGWLQLLLERMPRGWLETAGVGLWILVVSWIAHRLPVWPTSLTQSGLVLGAAMACIALGATTGFTFLQVFGLLNYLILWPFWLLRLGLFLLHPIPVLAPSFAHMRRKAEALGRVCICGARRWLERRSRLSNAMPTGHCPEGPGKLPEYHRAAVPARRTPDRGVALQQRGDKSGFAPQVRAPDKKPALQSFAQAGRRRQQPELQTPIECQVDPDAPGILPRGQDRRPLLCFERIVRGFYLGNGITRNGSVIGLPHERMGRCFHFSKRCRYAQSLNRHCTYRQAGNLQRQASGRQIDHQLPAESEPFRAAAAKKSLELSKRIDGAVSGTARRYRGLSKQHGQHDQQEQNQARKQQCPYPETALPQHLPAQLPEPPQSFSNLRLHRLLSRCTRVRPGEAFDKRPPDRHRQAHTSVGYRKSQQALIQGPVDQVSVANGQCIPPEHPVLVPLGRTGRRNGFAFFDKGPVRLMPDGIDDFGLHEKLTTGRLKKPAAPPTSFQVHITAGRAAAFSNQSPSPVEPEVVFRSTDDQIGAGGTPGCQSSFQTRNASPERSLIDRSHLGIDGRGLER